MRVRGAAGTDYDMRIRGAAGHQPQNKASPRLEAQVPYDPAHPQIPLDVWSRSSTRVQSSPNSEQQVFNGNSIDQQQVIQKNREQQKFINRLTSEKQALTVNVGNLTEANGRLTAQLERKQKKELRQVVSRDSELSRQQDEFISNQKELQHAKHYVKDLLGQVRDLGELPVPPPGDDFWLSSSTEVLQSKKPPGEYAPSGDDLNALDFPDDFDASSNLHTPVERRIQALGPTMAENDYKESQQPIIVSRWFRNPKESEKSSWSRPIEQTQFWPKVKDDPAFALRVGGGNTVSFEVLHKRILDLASNHSIHVDSDYQPNWSAVDEQVGQPGSYADHSIGGHLRHDQEDRLAALGVSGGPKPVKPHLPNNERDRSRSYSPESKGQRDQRHDYRQRGYETYRPGRQSSDEAHDSPRDREREAALEAAMDPATARNIGAKFGQGQQKQNRHKGRKGKGKNKHNQHQHQQHSAGPSYQRQRQSMAQGQPNSHEQDQAGWSSKSALPYANVRANSATEEHGRRDQREGTEYRW